MYQVFYLYPNNYFLVINRSENKHTGWRNPISDYFFHSVNLLSPLIYIFTSPYYTMLMLQTSYIVVKNDLHI